MKDFSKYKSKILDFFRNKKNKIYIFSGIVFIILFSALAVILTNEKGLNIPIVSNFLNISNFEVSGGNFDLGIKKLPYNAKSIDITFTHDLKEESISKDIFKINPEVPGVLKQKSSNTISYELSENLEIGKDYTITVFKDLLSTKGENLENDLVYIITTVPGAKVLRVLPEKNLKNLSQNIGVFFSLPQVPLTTLDEKDKLPCPLEITPKINGKCSWTTTSVLEFTPEDAFVGATKYDYEVKYKDGMNYELENTFSGSFVTPDLTLSTSDTFLPKNYIKLTFSYPVDIEKLEKNLELFTTTEIEISEETDKNLKNGSWKNLEFKLESFSKSENQFLIKLLSQEFFYNTDYKIEIKKGLKPKYGNVALKNDFSQVITSKSFVSGVTNYQNIYSETGTLIDTETISIGTRNWHYKYLPNKNIFFKVKFNEEISLNKDLFLFEDEEGNKVDFDISYVKEEKENPPSSLIKGEYEQSESGGYIIENKEIIKLELKNKLKNNKNYNLIVSKEANDYLKKDIIYNYTTSPELEILDYTFVNYSKSCLYLNNKIDSYNNDIKESLSFSNSGIIKQIDQGNNLSWTFSKNLGKENLTQEEKNKKLMENSYCPEAKDGQLLYAVNTRLNPKTKYTFLVKGLRDKYSNKLKEDFSKDVETGEIKEKDKYVYTHFNNYNNVYPKSAPIVIDIQTINLDKVYLDICLAQKYYGTYSNYSFNQSYDKCETRELEVKNTFWNLSHNKFDLEDDILGYKIDENFIKISIYTNKEKDKDDYYVQNAITRTNMSLFLEKAENKSLIFVTNLKDNKEIGNLKFEFYDYKFNKTNVSYSFNKEKNVYELDSSLSGINKIIAYNDNFYGVLDIGKDYFSNYDFKYISGTSTSEKNYVYIYTDRPIYRPGDEVQIKGLVRNFDFDGYKKTDLKKGTLTIVGDDWQDYRNLEINIDQNSNFTGNFIIPEDSKLGNFRFDLILEKINEDENLKEYFYSYGSFSIEEYKKPTFKVDIESAKSDFTLGDSTKIKIIPKYYFGGKMINTDGVYSVLTQNYFFDAKDYGDYTFGIGDNYFNCLYWGYCNYGDYLNDGTKDFKIDETGEFILDYNFGNKEDNGEKIYSFNFDVTDPDTKKTVSNSISKVLHLTDGYVGLKSKYYNDFDSGIDIEAITLDYEANPLKNKNVKVEVIKKEYKTVKKLGVDGIFYNDYSLEETLEKTLNLKTDEKGYLSKNLETLSSGIYEIKISYTGENKQTFTTSKTVYVAGENYISWGNDNNTVTELTTDKITYKIGEEAKFVLKSPVNNGKALVVIEKDDGIIDYFVHDIKSYGDEITYKVGEKDYPNVYIKVFLIGSEENNPLPVYKRALSVIKILTDYKNLNVSILTDKKTYKPADSMEITVEVVDASGKQVPNANGSLSVVDESVLALKGNPKKNPYAFFYEMRRYLGVVSYSSLKYLVEKLEIKDTSDGEKGGAGESTKGGDSEKLRGDFKDTAFWLSDFTTDENGKAVITIPTIPDNLTTWVIEALVTTPEDNKVGISYESVLSSKDIMIEDNLPRFLAGEDIITFSPVIYNRTGFDDEFFVNLEATNGKLKTSGVNVKIKNGESITVPFVFEVKKSKDLASEDISEIKITVNSKSNKDLTDGIIKYLPITQSGIPEYVSTIGKTDQVSFDENINISNLNSNNAKLKINYSATLFSYLLDGINFLSRYPYGCSEQKTSAIMPNIYIKKLYDIAGVDFDLKTKMLKKYINSEVGYKEISLDEAIKDYLIEIKKFQNTDGGFMYWYDTEYKDSNTRLTNYILVSLSNIKSIGYEVSENILKNASEYLKNEFYNKKTCSNVITNDCISSYMKKEIVFALIESDIDNYESYKMYKTLDLTNLGDLEKADIISKLSNITSLSQEESDLLKKEAIDLNNKILSNELVFNPKGSFLSSGNYGSRVYNTAKILEIMSNIGLENFKDSTDIIDNMIRFIASSKMNNSFGSTRDNSFVIRVLTTYLRNTGELKNTDLFARFNFNSTEIETKNIDSKNIFETFSKEIDSSNMKETNIFNVEKEGTGSIYYDLNLSYFVKTKDLKARDEGFFVEKKYFAYDEYKKIESLKNTEYQEYLKGEKVFEDLKYKKDILEYLTPIESGKIGDLVLVYNKLITNEARDQVAIESFIPAGSEIVNTALATETKTVSDNVGTNIYFDRKELRDDRYFAWERVLRSGIYNFSYVVRLTHSGNFKVKSTIVSEFYNPEVFGRSEGIEFVIE